LWIPRSVPCRWAGTQPDRKPGRLLEGTGYETRLNKECGSAHLRPFAQIRLRYREFFSGEYRVDTEIFKSQIPGGMISNMESQLRGQGAGDRLQEVLEEVSRVRKDAAIRRW